MKILIAGAQGMLGTDLVRLARLRGHDVIAASRNDLDITNEVDTLAFVQEKKPDVIINAAAYNLVDAAETPDGKALAEAINASGPAHLAKAARTLDIPFVHVSTEYVFAGTKQEGYREDDAPNPVASIYAITKLAGEQNAQKEHAKTYVVRTSKIFGNKGESPNTKESFVSLMLRLAKEKPEVNIVDEQYGCPTYVEDLANGVLDLVEQKYPFGTYHMVNAGSPVTPYGWAQEIFAAAGISPKANAVPADFFPTNAPRPKFAALINTKFPPLRERADALKEFLSV